MKSEKLESEQRAQCSTNRPLSRNSELPENSWSNGTENPVSFMTYEFLCIAGSNLVNLFIHPPLLELLSFASLYLSVCIKREMKA